MPTKRETVKALNQSIRHWDRHAKGKAAEDEGIYCDDCALCGLFLKSPACEGCPVSKRSGLPYCKGTPWREAENHYGGHRHSSEESDDFREAAAKMRDYLIELKEEIA